MNTLQRAKIAEDTLTIIEDGVYVNSSGKKVDISDEVRYAVENSRLYTPESFADIGPKISETIGKREKNKTEIRVNNETTLKAARRLKEEENYQNVVCLNFASAKHPGGGFLNGSSAQEESLARSSALYPTIEQMDEMYEANKNYDSALYLDYMIYSPQVPVFRRDDGHLLDNPYQVSFITAPAVNAGIVHSRESKENIEKIGKKMKERIEKILSIAVVHKVDALVLGAFGCGVFRNDPEEVAGYFKELVIEDERFNDYFTEIVFAVLDRSREKRTYNIFKKKLL